MLKDTFELKIKSNTGSDRTKYSFISADGASSRFRDAELALANNIAPEQDDNILVMQGGFGFLGVIMADQAREGKTVVAETSDRRYQLIKENFELNSIKNAEVIKTSFYSEFEENFSKVLYAPESYAPVDIVKNRLSRIAANMPKEGEIYVAGKKSDGIKRYRNHLKNLDGSVEKISNENGQRVYRYRKTDNFESEIIDTETSFKTSVRNKELAFRACKGIFSPKQLDKGSRLLLETIELSENSKILDLACGYGIIGIFLNKIYHAETYFTDDSTLATHYAEENFDLNDIDRYRLKNRDCLDGFKGEVFDIIVSNPPTHQGDSITSQIFEQAYNSLKKGGQLYIVYNQNMKFERQLEDIFSSVRVLKEKDNYLVARATK